MIVYFRVNTEWFSVEHYETVLDPSKLHLKFYIIEVIANQVPGFRLSSQSSSFIQYQITPGLGIEP